VAFYLSYMSAGVPGIWYAWYPDLIPHDHEMRGLLIAPSNMCGYINSIWCADAVWKIAETPKFRPGWIAATTFSIAIVLISLRARSLEICEGKKRDLVERSLDDVEATVVAVPVLEKQDIAYYKPKFRRGFLAL
jgi:ACS family pantothenate transporter-like MFS transporter